MLYKNIRVTSDKDVGNNAGAVAEATLAELDAKVNAAEADGWIPIGGIQYVIRARPSGPCHIAIQAMARVREDESGVAAMGSVTREIDAHFESGGTQQLVGIMATKSATSDTNEIGVPPELINPKISKIMEEDRQRDISELIQSGIKPSEAEKMNAGEVQQLAKKNRKLAAAARSALTPNTGA